MNSVKKNKTSFDEKLHSLKLNVTKRRLIWLLIPVAIILVGIILVSTIGFNLGIDFTGGTIINVVPNEIDISDSNNYQQVTNDIEAVLSEYGLKSTQFQIVENDQGQAVSVRFQDKAGADEKEMNVLINDKIIPALYEKFGMDKNDDRFANYVQASDRIGATSSSELLLKALIAIMASIVLILIYIAIRFEVASGLSAIVALFSDVLVTCSIVLMCRIQINTTFIAALITIIGYSINNTIIIFDRVRELRKLDENKGKSNEELANMAVSQSFARTLNTTITTLVAVLLLAIIGVPSVREFVIPIIIGLLSGVYSSLFLSPNLWALMYRERAKKNKGCKSKDSKSKVQEVNKTENEPENEPTVEVTTPEEN